MIQVGRQAVANVDHGMKKDEVVKLDGLLNARPEIEMFAADTASQWSRHHKPIARPRAGSANWSAARRLAQHGHRDHQRPVPGVSIATDDGRLKFVRHAAEAEIQFLSQMTAALTRQSNARDRRHWPACH